MFHDADDDDLLTALFGSGPEGQPMFHDFPVWALGAMSGTSLDGVDAAMVLTDGEVIHAFGPVAFLPYGDGERAVLRDALGRWPGEEGVEGARQVIDTAHVDVLWRFDRPTTVPRVEIVGFHGQTLAHDPGGRGTHQVGDGQSLAEQLQLPVVWDFRSADVAAGGQGAPLAPFFHHACARWAGLTEPVAFLNLGGVGNLTWVDPSISDPAAEGALVAFDTGPANAPINDLMTRRLGRSHDENGRVAASGAADAALVEAVLAHPYFRRPAPKSLDRDDFAASLAPVNQINDAGDAAATLVEIAARAVARGLGLCPSAPSRLLVTGGGRHNPAIMAALARVTGVPVDPVETVGLDGDMLEAQAFAWLAVRVARGLPISAPMTTGVPRPMTGGQLSLPMEIR